MPRYSAEPKDRAGGTLPSDFFSQSRQALPLKSPGMRLDCPVRQKLFFGDRRYDSGLNLASTGKFGGFSRWR
jgi:hypothetical protein